MQNFERRAIATARHVREKMDQTMTSVGLPLDKLPGMVQPVCDLVANSITGSASVSIDAVAECLICCCTVMIKTLQSVSYLSFVI